MSNLITTASGGTRTAPMAEVVEDILSDKSVAYNVRIYSTHGALLTTIGAINESSAQAIRDAIEAGAVWTQ